MYEFFQAAESLDRSGIELNPRAASLKPCPKKPRIIVYIDKNGIPVRMELAARPEPGHPMIERWSPNNHMAFPTVAVDPLFFADGAKLATLKKLLKSSKEDNDAVIRIINELVSSVAVVWDNKTKSKLARQFTGGNELLELIGSLPVKAESFIELSRRASMLNCDEIESHLETFVLTGIKESPFDWGGHIGACVISKEGKDIPPNTLLLSLELEDWHRYDYPANHRSIFDTINERLLKGISLDTAELDAFGLPLEGYKKPMPKLLLPSSGEKPLRSMFSEVPANYRYSNADAESFPVGTQSRIKMLTAGKWLTAPEREGKTWAYLTRKAKVGRSDIQPTLVLITPQTIPIRPPGIGTLFAPPSKLAEKAKSKFDYEANARVVADSIKGAWQGNLSTSIHVAVITSYDKGRYKLLMSENYTAEHMVNSAKRWCEGCANIPSMRYRVHSRKETYTVSPKIPMPSEMFQSLSTVWLRSGSACRTTRKVAQELPALLLLTSGQAERDLALTLLAKHLSGQEEILIALGVSLRKSGRKNYIYVLPKGEPRAYRNVEILPSVIGLLLYKAGRKLEDYMDDSFFLMGQLLSLTDTLHEQYCRDVRKGDLPPSLLGNSLMRQALTNPLDAFDQLADRILVYQAWARTDKGETSRLAKWSLGRFGEVSHKLHDNGVPHTVNAIGKAEMLLGYLASHPKKEEHVDSDEQMERTKE